MNFLKLQIFTTKGIFLEKNISYLSIFTSSGQIGILPNHIDLVTSIVSGAMYIIDTKGNKTSFFTGEGILSIKNNVISLVLDKIETFDEEKK